jgi:hypothetical protein
MVRGGLIVWLVMVVVNREAGEKVSAGEQRGGGEGEEEEEEEEEGEEEEVRRRLSKRRVVWIRCNSRRPRRSYYTRCRGRRGA